MRDKILDSTLSIGYSHFLVMVCSPNLHLLWAVRMNSTSSHLPQFPPSDTNINPECTAMREGCMSDLEHIENHTSSPEQRHMPAVRG